MSQFEEDTHRLPEGFIRIAYNADTEVYTFRDRKGNLYMGAPRSQYGVMTPISDKDPLPGTFESDPPQEQKPQSPPGSAPLTFQDFLPPECITSASASTDRPIKTSLTPPRTSAWVRFIKAAWKTALPKVHWQAVVHNLRRPKTSPNHTTTGSEDTEHLLRRAHGKSTSYSAVSVETRISVNSSR